MMQAVVSGGDGNRGFFGEANSLLMIFPIIASLWCADFFFIPLVFTFIFGNSYIFNCAGITRSTRSFLIPFLDLTSVKRDTNDAFIKCTYILKEEISLLTIRTCN